MVAQQGYQKDWQTAEVAREVSQNNQEERVHRRLGRKEKTLGRVTRRLGRMEVKEGKTTLLIK